MTNSVKDLVLTQGNYTAVDNNNISALANVEGIKANDLVVYSCLLHQSYIIKRSNFMIKSFLTKFDIGRKAFESSREVLERAGYINIERINDRYHVLHILKQTSDLKDFSAISNSLLMAKKNVLSISEKAFLIMFWKHIQPTGNHLDLEYHDTTVEDVLGNYASVKWFLKVKKSLLDKEVISVEKGNKFFFILNFHIISDILGKMHIETDAELTVTMNKLQDSELKVRELEREVKTLKSIAQKKTSYKKPTKEVKGAIIPRASISNNRGNTFDYGVDL